MDKLKCDKCKKTIRLFLFQCKCNGNFCMKHKFSDTHECKYDHSCKDKLIKDNPKILKNKINII